VEIWRIEIQAQPGQEVRETPFNKLKKKKKRLSMVVHICHPSHVGSINKKIMFQASLGIKQDPTSKITKGE
jgi:hypothetical protein